MATYITLIRWTEKGIENVKDSPNRLDAARGHEDAWGIMTRKDVVSKVVDPGEDPGDVKVFEIMSKPLIAVSPGLALNYCARLMNSAAIRRAVVFDGKEIVGMLSNTNIFKAIEV